MFRLILRMLLAPIILLLTAVTFLLALLLALSTRVLAIISSLGVTLSLLLFVTGDYRNGGIFLLLAWLISPIGLPLIAEWLWRGLDNVRGMMWRIVFC
ncbi:MAG: succinate dehydrogenase [Clostridia bacterium]|nr:succinate dehydrogenase [Clostridia bacterium]